LGLKQIITLERWLNKVLQPIISGIYLHADYWKFRVEIKW